MPRPRPIEIAQDPDVAAAEKARLKHLQTKPFLALPTVLLFYAGAFLASWLAWQGLVERTIPVVVAGVGAGITGYFLFSVIHDALHRSISRFGWINDLFAIGTVNLLLPYSSHKLLRWGHMQHHRHTNEEGKDPDAALTHLWHAPLTMWAFFELFYVPFYWRHRHERPRLEVIQVMAQLVLGGALLLGLFWLMGADFALYWFVATRVALWLIVAVFVWLPHQPHTIMQRDHPYQATLLRSGLEWLMTPLMAWQNWHLVHHLYPTVPFYRYRQAWMARREFHEAQHPVRVGAFQMMPDPAVLAAALRGEQQTPAGVPVRR